MVYSCLVCFLEQSGFMDEKCSYSEKHPIVLNIKYPIDTINVSMENLLPEYIQFLQNELKSFHVSCFSSFHLCSFCKILKMMVQSRFWRTPDVAWMNFWDSSSHKLVFVLNSNSQMFSAGMHILRLCDLLLVVAIVITCLCLNGLFNDWITETATWKVI